MRLQRKDIVILISFVAVFTISLIVAVTDYDFVWQTILGQKIVREHTFYGLSDLIWSTKYKGWYLDHEWLTNVIFYLVTSCFGEIGGILCYKIFIAVILSIELLILGKLYNINNFYTPASLVCLVVGIVYALNYINFKAYNISLLLLLALVILLENYVKGQVSYKGLAVGYLSILVLWNNLHSGSVFLAIVVAFLYWVLCIKDKATFILGCCSILCLCVNPFGYKLVLFDIYHFSNTVMKSISTDWAAINTSTLTGKVILFSLIVGFLCLIYCHATLKEPLTLLYGLFASLTIVSARHFLYLYPFFVIVLLRCAVNIKDKEQIYKKVFILLSLLLCSIQIIYWLNIKDIKSEYLHHYITDDLLVKIQNTLQEDESGFYDSDLDVWHYGIKSFKVGAFTYTEEQNIATYTLNHGSVTQIQDIIAKYGLNKFLIAKYKATPLGVQHTNMYDFLNQSSEYVLLYETERLAYFIEK